MNYVQQSGNAEMAVLIIAEMQDDSLVSNDVESLAGTFNSFIFAHFQFSTRSTSLIYTINHIRIYIYTTAILPLYCHILE